MEGADRRGSEACATVKRNDITEYDLLGDESGLLLHLSEDFLHFGEHSGLAELGDDEIRQAVDLHRIADDDAVVPATPALPATGQGVIG